MTPCNELKSPSCLPKNSTINVKYTSVSESEKMPEITIVLVHFHLGAKINSSQPSGATVLQI
jgi:hypothetical protein